MRSLCLLVLLSCSLFSSAQQWSGIISSERAIDWTKSGVSGGIPSRTTVCATISPGTTTASIQSTINSCAVDSVVMFASGTHNVGTLTINKGLVLRGAGPTSTFLNLSGNIVFARAPGSGGLGSYPSGVTVRGWTAGYSDGSDTLTLSSTTGLTAGMELLLDQLNDGNVVFTTGQAGLQNCGRTGSTFEGGSTRCQFQITKVQSVSGNQVVIDPPLYRSYQSGQTPQATSWTSGNIQNAGIENMAVDANLNNYAILFSFCTGCWAKNIVVNDYSRAAVRFFWALRGEIRDSYISGSAAAGPTQYGWEIVASTGIRIENTIARNSTSPLMPESSAGIVVAYNYFFNTQAGWLFASINPHLAHNWFHLYEGNIVDSINTDNIWGSSSQMTMFRNYIHGNPSGKTNNRTPIIIQAHSRWQNVLGNVLGSSGLHTRYQVDNVTTGGADDFIFALGYWSNWYDGTASYDATVKSSLMRWGNWDVVTNAVRWNSSEVPTGDATYSNTVPATQTLPASFIYTTKPAWYGSSIWPPIGPEVAGGNISGVGGHANKIPAQICYETLTVNAQGVPTNFNADTCYTATPPGAVSPPSNLRIIFQLF